MSKRELIEIVERLETYRQELYIEQLKYDDGQEPNVRKVTTILEELDGILEGEF